MGKKVRVEIEFVKANERMQSGQNMMNFASVMIQRSGKKDLNLAVSQLEKGFARTNIKMSGDNVSKYLEDLLVAEKKSQDSKQGLNGKKAPPMTVYTDLVGNTARVKEYESLFAKRKTKVFNAVVEYCFSGMRFKVRLNDEGCCIALNLFGVRTMDYDKNQPTLMEYSNDAKKFAHSHLFQRDVQVEMVFTDKRGNFFGYLITSDKKNFANKLLEAGLCQVSYQGNRVPRGVELLSASEDQAKGQEIGIWNKSLKLMSSGADK